MANPPLEDQDHPIDPREVRAGESPHESVCPFWVKACLRLAPPTGRTGKPITSIGEAVDAAGWFAADRMPVHGKKRLITSRDDLAALLGKSRGDKVAWITDYFELIQFLTVHQDHDRDPVTGKMRGHLWVVNMHPPIGYVGPRNAHELADALRRDDRPRSIDELFLKAQVTPTPPREGVDFAATTPRGEKPRSRPLPPGREPLKKKEASLPEGKGSEASASLLKCDAATLRGAGAVAPEEDPMAIELAIEVDRLINRLPWEQTVAGRTSKVLGAARTELAPAIVAAVRNGWVTLEQAQDHALAKLAEGDRGSKRGKGAALGLVKYVARGFAPDRLPSVELPPPDDVLAFPVGEAPENGPEKPAEAPTRRSESSGTGEACETREKPAEGLWCGDCLPARGRHGGPVCAPTCENRTRSAA